MRYLFLLIIVCLLAHVAPSNAEEAGEKPGDYGFMHKEYHRNGAIDELLAKTGNRCCDGSGECRATYARMNKKENLVLIEEMWCPLSPDTKIRYDVTLPNNGFILLCAGRATVVGQGRKMCPTTYCLAAQPGG